MRDIEQFRHFTRCLQIAHQIPGRVRLKLDPIKAAGQIKVDGARDFQHLLDDIPGVTAIRLNVMALSCIVEYDPAVIPDAAWPDVLNGVSSVAAERLLDILESKYRQCV
jgi:hypothetical protein